MKNKLKYFLLVAIAISLFACGESEPTYFIEGKVISYGEEKGISEAKLFIVGGNPNGGLGGTTEFIVDSIFTDGNGNFKWDSNGVREAAYYSIAHVEKENYFDHTDDIPINENYTEITLDPHAWLHLNAIDDPIIPGDYLETYALFIQPNEFGEFEEQFLLRGNRYIYKL